MDSIYQSKRIVILELTVLVWFFITSDTMITTR